MFDPMIHETNYFLLGYNGYIITGSL
jgi:hypothetical protein